MKVRSGFVTLVALAGVACSQGESGGAAVVSPEVARGKQIYQTTCIACHASDPSQAGALGPPVAGASIELLEAKVLRNEYPPGYTPKRESRAMLAMPHLAGDIPALHAYLASVAKGS